MTEYYSNRNTFLKLTSFFKGQIKHKKIISTCLKKLQINSLEELENMIQWYNDI